MLCLATFVVLCSGLQHQFIFPKSIFREKCVTGPSFFSTYTLHVNKLHFTAGSCRSRSRKKKKGRCNRRRGSLDGVPPAAGSVNTNVSASSLLEIPAFRIVCVDDNSHFVDALSEYSPSSSPDPLCLNIKVDPGILQVVSANTMAANHAESSSLLCAEKVVQLTSRDAASLPASSVISPLVMLDDGPGTCFQPSVNHDPLQLNDVKISLERFEREIDAHTQPSDTLLREISELHASSVPSSVVFRTSSINTEVSCNSPMLDKVNRLDPFGETRCPAPVASAEVDELNVSSQPISPVDRPQILSECVTDSDSNLNSKIMSVCQAYEVPLSRNRCKSHKCLICGNLIAQADFLQHLKSHELSTTGQTQKPRRRGAAYSVLNSSACTIGSLETSNIADFCERLGQHDLDESNGNAMPQPTLRSSGQLTSSSLTSSPSCAPLAKPKRTSVPFVKPLDNDTSRPVSRPSSSRKLQTTSSPSTLVKTSVRPAFLSNSNVSTALSSQITTKANRGQVKNNIQITSDLSGLGGISSLPTASRQPQSLYQSTDSLNLRGVPITDCPTNSTFIPPLNEGARSFYPLPQFQGNIQQESRNLDSTLFNRPVDRAIGPQEVPNTKQSYQKGACSVKDFSQSRRRRVDALETAIIPSEVTQPTKRDNGPSNGRRGPQPKLKRSLEDLCIQTDIIVMPDGSIKKTHTLRRRSLAEVSKHHEPSSYVSSTFPLDQSSQCVSNQLSLSDSPNGVLPDSIDSGLLSRQHLQTASREAAAVQLSPEESSVNLNVPLQSPQKLHATSKSAFQSDKGFSNKPSDLDITHQSQPFSANESTAFSKQTASHESTRNTDSLLAPSAVQSPTSSILNQPVSKEPVQVIDNLYGLSKESHDIPRYSESLNVTDNDVQSLTLNQSHRSTSTVQMQSSAQPNAPLPPISANPPPLSFLNRIDRLIETNAEVLIGTQGARMCHPFNMPTKSATSTPENCQSFLRSEQSAHTASLCQDVNLNPSSRINFERHLQNTSTASLSQRTVSTPALSRDNGSSDDVPHAEIDRGDCILLEESADLSSGLQKPNKKTAKKFASSRNCAPSKNAKSTRSTYDLRGFPRKSQRTHTPSEKLDNSSAESDESALSDPDYLPQLDLHSDDSDNPDDSNAVLSTFPKITKPLPSVPLLTKPVANTGDKENCGISRTVPTVSIACLGTPSSASGVSVVACARTQSKGEPMQNLDSTLPVSSQKSYKKRDGDVLNVSNLRESSEHTGLPGPSAAPKSSFSRESTDPSVNQSLRVFSAECSTNASRANNLSFAASAECFPVSSDLVASAFSEAHSLVLANDAGSTCAMPSTSQCAIATASSVREPHESTSSISTNYTGMKADASNFETIRTNITNGNRSKPLSLEGLPRNGTTHVLEISTAVTSKDDSGRGVNLIPTTLETEQNSNCEQPQYRRKNTNEIIGENTKSTESSHTKGQFESTDSFLSTRLPIPAATVESQRERSGTIPELQCSEKSSICCNKGAPTGITPSTGVGSIYSPPRNHHASSRDNTGKNKQSSNVVSDIASDNAFRDTACKGLYRSNYSPSPNQPASSKDTPRKPQQTSSAVVIASDDSSTDVDDPDPKTSRRKRSSSCSSSESGESTMVDPDYVPPSHDKLPLKTPDSVLDAIPTYEFWVRNKFVQDESETDTPKPDNACCVCQRKFPKHESLKEHRAKRYSDLKCCKCSFKASTEKTLKSHTNKHWRTKPYVCEECSQTFWKRGKYVKHFLMHRNDFYYICNICDQGFNDYHPYENHINKHLNKTPYKCLKCDLAFTAKALLSCHKKRMHKRKAFTECTVCKKSINKFWLADHMKRHEQKDVKKYLCEQCGKEVKSKLSLSRHILKHTGERPHMCKYCGATFKVQNALKQHERKHTGERPFKCEVCGKTFAYNTPYTYHLRTHTGERPYKCEYCGMTFAQPSPYAVHKRLHTGERPYKCKICDDAFPSHASVRNHMQTHANSENKLKRGRKTEGKTSKPKKPRKERSASVVDTRSSSDSEKESTEVGVVQPRRRSARQTKCTKSLVEEGSDSGESQK